MALTCDDEELPLPLLRRSTRPARVDADQSGSLRRDYRDARSRDRMSPSAAGALMGFLAGPAGLLVVHALHATTIGQGIARLSAASEIPPDASTPLAYLAVALAGAFVGAVFAAVTRNLRRRYLALLAWGLVFFGSLTVLVLALSSVYGRARGLPMAPAILLASAAYALVWSLELPLRRRATPDAEES